VAVASGWLAAVMYELTVQVRKKEKHRPKSLRKQGLIPAVLYRKGKENVNLQMDLAEFRKVFKEAGESTAVKLNIVGDGEEIKNRERNVLIHDIARDPISGYVIHVDFYEVRMDEKTTARVPLVFVGESPAIKTSGGTLIKNINEIDVEALVKDLPRQIEVDVSLLETIDDVIYVKNILAPEGVKILAKPDDIVVLVAPPRK
jgi:large subunit ribosomal protein L25